MEVSIGMSQYDVSEGDMTVEVCATLATAPAMGLECSVVATLTLTDGDKAGEF